MVPLGVVDASPPEHIIGWHTRADCRVSALLREIRQVLIESEEQSEEKSKDESFSIDEEEKEESDEMVIAVIAVLPSEFLTRIERWRQIEKVLSQFAPIPNEVFCLQLQKSIIVRHYTLSHRYWAQNSEWRPYHLQEESGKSVFSDGEKKESIEHIQ
jgi:hypothetical protein